MELTPPPLRLAVLVSGRGSNLLAILDAIEAGQLTAQVVLVVANRPDAAALEHAAARGIDTAVVDHRAYAERTDFDTALAMRIAATAPDLVVLAGFMRVLGAAFVRAFEGRLLNIHPSLLPRHRGLHTHARVLEAGEREHGASVHFVDCTVDTGPVIAQTRIAVHPDDTPDTLAARLLPHEHRLYPEVLRWFAQGRLTCEGNSPLLDGAPLHAPVQVSFDLAEPA